MCAWPRGRGAQAQFLRTRSAFFGFVKRIPVDQTECGKDYDRFSTGAAGILRYRREPDHTMCSATVRAVVQPLDFL